VTELITDYMAVPVEYVVEGSDAEPQKLHDDQYPDRVTICHAYGGGSITVLTRSLNGMNHCGVAIPYDEFARMVAEIISNAPPAVLKMVNDRLDAKGNLRRDA
jgi:hypothetical protein